jgi:uncharacterized protein YgiM (DUF1202 family)
MMKGRRIMQWISLTIFLAVMLFAYYVADKLDKRDERKHKHQVSAGAEG